MRTRAGKELGGSAAVPGAGSGAAAGGGGGGPPLATGLADGGVLDDHRGEDGLLVPPGRTPATLGCAAESRNAEKRGVRRRAPPLEREVPSPRGGEGGAAWGRDGGARRRGRAREREMESRRRERGWQQIF